jgi:hypothetical protein
MAGCGLELIKGGGSTPATFKDDWAFNDSEAASSISIKS